MFCNNAWLVKYVDKVVDTLPGSAHTRILKKIELLYKNDVLCKIKVWCSYFDISLYFSSNFQSTAFVLIGQLAMVQLGNIPNAFLYKGLNFYLLSWTDCFGWVLWGTTHIPLVVYVDTVLCNTLQATHWWPTHPGNNLRVWWSLQYNDIGYEYLGLEGSRVRHSLGIVRTTRLSTAVATYRIIIYILYLYIYIYKSL